MNKHYADRYARFIQNYMDRVDGYFESHHIIPLCQGGADEPSNIVRLSARAHYIAHLLLARMYPESKGLSLAVILFNTNKRGIKMSSRLYERERLRFSTFMKSNNPMKDPNIAKKVSEARKGCNPPNLSPEGLRRIVESKTGANNPCFGRPAWLSNRATELSLSIWKSAQTLREAWEEGPCGYHKLAMRTNPRWATAKALNNMVNKFAQGWIPKEDPAWVSWANYP